MVCKCTPGRDIILELADSRRCPKVSITVVAAPSLLFLQAFLILGVELDHRKWNFDFVAPTLTRISAYGYLDSSKECVLDLCFEAIVIYVVMAPKTPLPMP
jgi:hypothetical protein